MSYKNFLFFIIVLSFSFVAQEATNENQVDQIEEVVAVGTRERVKT